MSWLAHNIPLVTQRLTQHLALALPAVIITLLISVPLGYWLKEHPKIGKPIVSIFSLSYAIPSLPMLIVIPAFLGVPLRSGANVIIALTIYGIALMLRTVVDAFTAIPDHIRMSSIAMGYTRWGAWWHVDLPLALPALFAGLRVVIASSMAMTSIGALVGIPSLGSLLTDGFQRGIIAEVSSGLLVLIMSTLVLDWGTLILTKALTPWQRHNSQHSSDYSSAHEEAEA
ncbi:ABC transporter permease [Alloscardovia omnicolens]|uniref:ABC transporter permease n=1 Tax=Alloscardovia omnicolens TaxID=419015 RepID=UPI003A6F4121